MTPQHRSCWRMCTKGGAAGCMSIQQRSQAGRRGSARSLSRQASLWWMIMLGGFQEMGPCGVSSHVLPLRVQGRGRLSVWGMGRAGCTRHGGLCMWGADGVRGRPSIRLDYCIWMQPGMQI